VAQLDDGATPILISSAIAKALRVPLRTRDRPVVITGMGGKTLCTQECTLYIRVVGESLHAGLDAVEGLYGIHFLVHPTCPFPMLIGTLSMDYHFINSQRQFRRTVFGNAGSHVYMRVPPTPYGEARCLMNMPPVAR
jgi:hypothetical protein